MQQRGWGEVRLCIVFRDADQTGHENSMMVPGKVTSVPVLSSKVISWIQIYTLTEYVKKNSAFRLFIALLWIPNKWKHHYYPLNKEWIEEKWYIKMK